jgi:hypothetical protein
MARTRKYYMYLKIATTTLPFEIKLNSKWKPNENGTM